MNVAYEFPMTETSLTSVFGGQGFGIWEAFFCIGVMANGILAWTYSTNHGSFTYRHYHCLLVTDVEFYECSGDSGGY